MLVLAFRWHNHLNPLIKKDAWTLEEEVQLINAHQIHGNKWAEIAKFLPGRYCVLVLFFLIPFCSKELFAVDSNAIDKNNIHRCSIVFCCHTMIR